MTTKKRSLRIKLINAAFQGESMQGKHPFMPLSLPVIAGSAPQHDYTFVDMLKNESPDFYDSPDIVGISLRNSAVKTAFDIADRYSAKGVTIVIGGPQATLKPETAIRHADSVVVGEGEELWPVLLKDYESGALKNYYVCSKKEFRPETGSVYQVYEPPDLSVLRPQLRGAYQSGYRFDTVYAVRGCPHNCDFCNVTEVFGAETRTRPVKDVVKEIDTLGKYFYLIDDNVFGRPDLYDYYTELYTRIGELKRKRFWMGQANLSAVADEKGRNVIVKAAESGMIYAAVGIESINEKSLRESGAYSKTGIKEGLSVQESIKRNIRFIQEQGIVVSGWFIVGYGDDDISTFYSTLDFCMNTQVIPVIFPLFALPGSSMYKKLESENRIDPKAQVNMYHPEISVKDMNKAISYIIRRGLSLRSGLKRLIYYFMKFRGNRIHHSIFLLCLTQGIRKAVRIAPHISHKNET